MTSLTSLIEQGKVTPNERGSLVAWWAYIHAYDGTVKVKRWFPLEDSVDDLAYAKQEKEEGNEFILYILWMPFAAEAHEAQERAVELIRDQLLRDGLRVRKDPARSPPLYLEPVPTRNPLRFVNLDID